MKDEMSYLLILKENLSGRKRAYFIYVYLF